MKICKNLFSKLKRFYKPKLVRKVLIGVVLIGIIFSSLGASFSYKAPAAKAAEPEARISKEEINNVYSKTKALCDKKECGYRSWWGPQAGYCYITSSSCKDDLKNFVSSNVSNATAAGMMNDCLDEKFESGAGGNQEGNLSVAGGMVAGEYIIGGGELGICLEEAVTGGGFWKWLGGKFGEAMANAITFITRLIGGALGYLINWVLGGIEGVLSVTNFTKVPAVKTAWGVIRDICNMFFILILLAIAFGTILGIESYHAKRLLPMLVIGILLVNFSMMICGIIVDFSQVLILSFLSPLHGQSLAEVLRNGLETSSYGSAVEGATVSLGATAYVSILSLIVEIGILVTLLVLLIMLVIRIVAIWILVTLSPLVFVAQILPATQQYAKKWWQEFLKYVMFGPAIAFFLMLTVLVIKGGDITQITQPANYVEPVTNQIGIEKEVDTNPPLSTKASASTFLQTVFILCLLGAGMFIAKQSSVVGAGAVVGGAGKVAKWGAAPLKKGAIAAGKGAGYLAKTGARKTGVPSWFKARGEKMAEWKERRELAEKERIAKRKIPMGLPKEEKKKEKARIETRFLAKEAAVPEIREEAEARVETLKPEDISTTISREKNPAMIYAMIKKAGQEGKLEAEAFKYPRVQKFINREAQGSLKKIAEKKNPLVHAKVEDQAKVFAKLSGDDLAKVSSDAIRGASVKALEGIDPATIGRAVERGSSEFRDAVQKQLFYFRSETQVEIKKQLERLGM